MRKPILLLSLSLLALPSFGQRGSKEWVQVGSNYRVVSDLRHPTLCAKTLEYLEETWGLQAASTIPDRGDTPERQAKIRKFKEQLAARDRRNERLVVPYDTPVTAVRISDKRERFGLPTAVQVRGREGAFRGKTFWVKYGHVRPYAPVLGEEGIVRELAYGTGQANAAGKLSGATASAVSAMVRAGDAVALPKGTRVVVIGTVVPGLFQVRVLNGQAQGTRLWVPRSVVLAQ